MFRMGRHNVLSKTLASARLHARPISWRSDNPQCVERFLGRMSSVRAILLPHVAFN